MLPAIVVLIFFAGCKKEKDNTYTYRIATPVYESKSVVYEKVKSEAPKQLDTPGKIFIIGKYLFISEAGKGVHVYDNSNPIGPKAISFINIPGNEDVVVKGNYLYADLYSDLVTIDISDPRNAQLVDKTSNIFTHKYSQYGWQFSEDQFIVEYIEKDTTVVWEEYDNPLVFWGDCSNCFAAVNSGIGQPKANYTPGIAGSMARLVLAKNYLYVVTTWSLISVDLANAAAPEKKNETMISWNIETVYPFKNRLFIGSADGMFIYNIDDPATPVAEGSFSHARACDPVITDGDHAYVTLRTGDQCAGNSNQLDVLDVNNISQPRLVKTYPLFNPHGLGKDGDLLFVCDGTDGIKVFNASKVDDLKLVGHISGVNAYDVIPWNGLLIASTKEGLSQYDYSDVKNIKLLSTIR